MNTLSAADIIVCLEKLADAERWLRKIQADSDGSDNLRIGWINHDIAHVRRTLLSASASDVAVEPVPHKEAA